MAGRATSAHQVYYSLIGRDYEWELMPLALDQGVGALVWSPLGWGRLTGKIRRGQPLPEESRLQRRRDKGPQVADEHLYKVVDALDESPKETGKTRAADRVELAAAAADGVDGDHWRAQRRAVAAESRRGRLEPDGGANREARSRQRRDAGRIRTGTSASLRSGTRRRFLL